MACAENFDALGDLLASYPQIATKSHFLFVPGPMDPWGSSTLPRPPIPDSFISRMEGKLDKVHFGSNPCRVKFCGQELVVFRHDLMAKMLRNLVGVKPDVDGADLKRYVSFAWPLRTVTYLSNERFGCHCYSSYRLC